MGDVLDDRDYAVLGYTYPAEGVVCSSVYSDASKCLARHVIDLKAEVVRLRAQKAELTVGEREAVEYARSHRVHTTLLDIIDRLCPPKAPPTLAELADIVEIAASDSVYQNALKLREVAAALRAMSK